MKVQASYTTFDTLDFGGRERMVEDFLADINRFPAVQVVDVVSLCLGIHFDLLVAKPCALIVAQARM